MKNLLLLMRELKKLWITEKNLNCSKLKKLIELKISDKRMLIIREKFFLMLNKKKCINWRPKLKQVVIIWKSKWTKIWLFYRRRSIYMLRILNVFKDWCQDWQLRKEKKLMNWDDWNKSLERHKLSWANPKRWYQTL